MEKECRRPKIRKEQANKVQEISINFDFSELYLNAVVFETNLVDNPNEWWVDTGASRHIGSDKEMFSSYTQISKRKLFMENYAMSDIVGIGMVVLKMTSGIEPSLMCIMFMK